jgi:hypothetical protein
LTLVFAGGVAGVGRHRPPLPITTEFPTPVVAEAPTPATRTHPSAVGLDRNTLLETNLRFRILSLDGGGIKGTFIAAALAILKEATGKRCVVYFDLITDTSTDGIIAIGLGWG